MNLTEAQLDKLSELWTNPLPRNGIAPNNPGNANMAQHNPHPSGVHSLTPAGEAFLAKRKMVRAK